MPPFSSGLILLFYAALYAFLAAMFGGCLFCLMWSISPYHPTFNDRVMPPGKKNKQKNTHSAVSAASAPSTSTSSSCLWPQVSAQLTVCVSPLAGMTMAPHLEGHEITFNASDRKSWKKYARSMDEYLRRESFQRSVHTSLATFIPVSSCNAYWEGKALCRLSVAAECVFFFFFSFQCPAFVRLNQKPEAGRAWL